MRVNLKTSDPVRCRRLINVLGNILELAKWVSTAKDPTQGNPQTMQATRTEPRIPEPDRVRARSKNVGEDMREHIQPP